MLMDPGRSSWRRQYLSQAWKDFKMTATYIHTKEEGTTWVEESVDHTPGNND